MKNRPSLLKSILILTLLICSVIARGQEDSLNVKNKFAPDYLRLQYAGNTGLVAIGPSWLILNEKLELGGTFGYVPPTSLTESIFTTSIKIMYTPKWEKEYQHFVWDPLSVGVVGCQYFGLDLDRYSDTEFYPDNYYWWGVKSRVGLALDTEFKRKLKKGPFSDVSFYIETSVWDVYFFSVFGNENDQYLGVEDLTVMGLGLKFFFKK